MLSGWYCRSMANMQSESGNDYEQDAEDDRDLGANDSDDDSRDEQTPIDYKVLYHNLKRKLKYLLYENESFQSALQSCQRRHLKVARDRSFLLDRLLLYEKVDPSSSESEETETSDEEPQRSETIKRKRDSFQSSNHGSAQNVNIGKPQPPPAKKKRTIPVKQNRQANVASAQVRTQQPESTPPRVTLPSMSTITNSGVTLSDGRLTAEEVERHLQSRQSGGYRELLSERAPPTVPTEMFSNDPSLDSESNDLLETSPSNIGEECLSVDMNLLGE
ncbi:uncharacterized protein LOC113386832 [Ctenocephalides felis]|uniref:uncharacterized protein LOC113386832 n=1 Tax=Ctenocephalides felis TaxID=7515 RepID=UPI000E6E147C|nr:uncharacterized protein LOC113386832 [Ctenocephalides felis]